MAELFRGRGREDFLISGPQFDIEATKVKVVAFTSVGTGVETAYTVPDGKNFFITKMMLINKDSSASTWTIEIDGDLIYDKVVTANSTFEIDFPSSIVARGGVLIEVDSSFGGSKIAIIGWET